MNKSTKDNNRNRNITVTAGADYPSKVMGPSTNLKIRNPPEAKGHLGYTNYEIPSTHPHSDHNFYDYFKLDRNKIVQGKTE